MSDEHACPLCDWKAKPTDDLEHDIAYYSCEHCGSFSVPVDDRDDFLLNSSKKYHQIRWRVSALVRESKIHNYAPFFLFVSSKPYQHDPRYQSVQIDELLGSRWPRNVPDRLNRILLNLAALSPSIGFHISHGTPWDVAKRNMQPIYFSQDDLELKYCRDALRVRNDIDCGDFWDTITVQGWGTVAELERRTGSSNHPAFVAMSFGTTDRMKEEMRVLFSDGIQPAIIRAGYTAMRVDFVEHNNYIMDEVISGIRLAPFLVSDFTEHREGVYYEAGFGRGLGKEVINCCRADHMGKAHFDTRQLNHILWEHPDDLLDPLYHRIIGTVGPGPNHEKK